MTHNEYTNLFIGLAETHKDLRHGEAGSDYPTGERKTFFRSNQDEELIQSLGEQVDVPLMLLKNYTGQFRSQNSLNVDDSITGGFMILTRADNMNFAQIDDAKDQCKTIATQIIAEMQRLYLDEGRCGPIDDFDIGTVRYEFVGPLADNLHGVAFYFNFTEQAFHLNTIDLDTAFQRD